MSAGNERASLPHPTIERMRRGLEAELIERVQPHTIQRTAESSRQQRRGHAVCRKP